MTSHISRREHIIIIIKAFRPFVFLRTWELLSDSANAECEVNSRKTIQQTSDIFGVFCNILGSLSASQPEGYNDVHAFFDGVTVDRNSK